MNSRPTHKPRTCITPHAENTMARMPKLEVEVSVQSEDPVTVLAGMYRLINPTWTPERVLREARLGARLLGLGMEKIDEIDKARHYNRGRFEVINVTDDWQMDHYSATIVTYVARAPHKGTCLKDLRKARYYLDRLIRLTQDGEGPLGYTVNPGSSR